MAKVTPDVITKAAKEGDIKKVEESIIQHPEFVNMKNKSGSTMLFDAAYYGKKEVIALLLRYGADATIINLRNNSALDQAVFKDGKMTKDRIEVISLLLDHGAQFNLDNPEVQKKIEKNKNIKDLITASKDKKKDLERQAELHKLLASKEEKFKADMDLSQIESQPKETSLRKRRLGFAHFRLYATVENAVFEISCQNGNQNFLWLGHVVSTLYCESHNKHPNSLYCVEITNLNGHLLLPYFIINQFCKNCETVIVHLSGFNPHSSLFQESSKSLWQRFAEAEMEKDGLEKSLKTVFHFKPNEIDLEEVEFYNNDNLIDPVVTDNEKVYILSELNSWGFLVPMEMQKKVSKDNDELFEIKLALPRGLRFYFSFFYKKKHFLSKKHEIVDLGNFNNQCQSRKRVNTLSIPTLLESDLKAMKDATSKIFLSSIRLNNEQKINSIIEDITNFHTSNTQNIYNEQDEKEIKID